MSDYASFLLRKTQDDTNYGFDPVWTPEFLFEFQHDLVSWSTRKGHAAILADCGLGKTPMQLVWAENVHRKTGRPVLLVAPLAVTFQTLGEAEKFGVDAAVSRTGKITAGVTITNYDRLHLFDPDDVAGMVADESSAIKSFDSERKDLVTRYMRKLPYRLLCTATAAPNDYMELGTSSEALGYLGYQDMLTRWFTNKDRGSKYRATRANERDAWRFKGHAEGPFWRWVASWARAMRKPSDLGYSDEGFARPPVTYRQHIVDATQPADGRLFDVPAARLHEEREESRRTIIERCETAAALLADAEHAVAWCQLNDEGDLLTKLIDGAVQVKGSDHSDQKEESLLAFSRGEIRVLVTKPAIGAWGMNWEHCHRTTYFPNHCYDETTEVLTRLGWKTFEFVTTDDDLATVHPETQEFEWQAPSRVVWEPYEGPMLAFEGQRNFDLLVTPNHNLYVQRCPTRFPNADASWGLMTASKVAGRFRRQEYRMMSVAASATGPHPSTVPIPAYGRVNSRSRIVREMSAEDFMRLAGWYLSEGSCGPLDSYYRGRIVISQSDKHPEYRTEIIGLLKRLGLHVNDRTKDITASSINLCAYLIDQFGAGSWHKRIPRWVKDLHPDLLVILRDTMMKGDGDAEGGYYKSVSRQLRDDFQEVCLRTGVRASVHNDYVSMAWVNLRPSVHRKPSTVDYSGMVGCATVPNHTLIVRRNGIPVVSGNSFEQFYQSVRRFDRFGQQHPVTVDVVTTEGGRKALANLQRKSAQADRMFDALIASMANAHSIDRSQTYDQEVTVPHWL